MKNFIICLISGIMLSSCGSFMDGMAAGMMGMGNYGGYGVPYYLNPQVAAQNAVNQMNNQFSPNFNWPSGTSVPVVTTSTSPVTGTTGGTISSGSSTSSSRRICVTCNGGGKCNGCHGSGLRTDNYFGTGTGTKTCGVCNGRKICSVCGGSGYK